MINEKERLDALRSYRILDTPPEARLDRLTRLAAEIFGTPIALVSLLDEHRQWFKSRVGYDVAETPREWSFCDHLVRSGDSTLVVQDATTDWRFASNPLVTEPPKIRFYAGAPLVAPSGHALGALCVVDVTPREAPAPRELELLCALADMASDVLELGRRAEQSDEHGAMLELAAEMSGIGHWQYEIGQDKLFWSEKLYALHGLTRETFTPTLDSMQRLYVPEDRQILGLNLELTRDGCEGFTMKLRRARADGTICQLTCKAECRRDKAGHVVALIGVMQDVSAQHEASHLLTRSEGRFRLLAEHSRDMLTHVGPDGVRRYVSPASQRIFGMSPEEMRRTDSLEGIHVEDRAAVARLQLQLLSGAVEEGSVIYRAQQADGGQIWVESSARAVRHAETGAPDGYVTVLRDVSRRQEDLEQLRRGQEEVQRANADLERLAGHLAVARDEAQAATRAKSRFLSTMSNELRTPLNGMLGYLHLLRQKTGLDAEQEAWLQTALDAGRHLLATIGNVRDLSDIEVQRPHLHPEAAELADLLQGCVDLLRPAADRKELRLTAALAPDTPHRISTDITCLRQILLNLLANAVKFTMEGAVTLLAMAAAQPGRLRFEVADTGPGIAAERRGDLFRGFERQSDMVGEGNGLGLAISAKLAELLDGAVGYSDRPEGGSLFWVEIACDVLAEDEAAPLRPSSGLSNVVSLAEAAALNTIAPLPAHVLVVGEAAMNRDIITAFLHSAGHHVSCASNGAEALALAAAETFQVVLMDMHMSGMDGPETTRRLRAIHGPNARVPVIAMMQLPKQADIEKYRAAGMDTHLPKPFTCPQLLDAVSSALTLRLMQSAGQMVAQSAAPPAVPALWQPETDAPVCDIEMFDRTASFLSREDVRKHVKTLAARSEEILGQLCNGNVVQLDLVAAAHSVAGSAGMFGFQRLSQSARRYEQAIERGLPEREPAARGLVAAIETTLQDMRGRLAS